MSISLNNLGDFYIRRGERGDADSALESYQQSHEIRQILYAQNPNDAEAARDLSIALKKLGDIYMLHGEHGMADRALASYEQSLEITQRLYTQNPNNTLVARDLSVYLNALGDFYMGRSGSGDLGRAQESYQQSHEICKIRYAQNPNDAEAARGLYVSLVKLGDFYMRRRESRDVGPVLDSFEQSLEIAQILYKQNPNDAQTVQDLVISITRRDVDEANPFPAMIRRFMDWVGPEPFLFCSWGAYDLHQFRVDCRRHGMPFPAPLENHLDLKRLFAEQCGLRPDSMREALRRLGLPLIGTHHRGIDDARNIARIVAHVLPAYDEAIL